MKYYFLYKTTNTITGDFYFGMHTALKLEDGYIGSGTRLLQSIDQYGIEHHTREILEFFSTREDLIKAERELITEDLLSDPKCLNMRPGGHGGGGFSREQQRLNNKKSQERQQWLRDNDVDWVNNLSRTLSASLTKSYKDGNRTSNTKPHPKGWTHSDETKTLISHIKSGTGVGSTNSNAKRVIDEDGVEYGCINDCAHVKNVSPSTISRWIKSGKYSLSV